ncbi:MAG: hypothetical protein OHK0029_30890 [Armatimonadaceae bacterium]
MPDSVVHQYIALNRKRAQGFTLIEILIVVAIVGVLLSVALPNFIRAGEKTRARTCAKQLSSIAVAKEAYMMENNLGRDTPEATFTDAVLYGPTRYIKIKPTCPNDGVYSVGDGHTDPTCDYQGGGVHVLSDSGG